MTVQTVIVVATALFLSLLVARPYFQLRKVRTPTPQEWRFLQQEVQSQSGSVARIRLLRREEVFSHPGLGQLAEDTRHALGLVLGRDAGYGRLSFLPIAIDEATASLERLVHTLRVLGSQAVIVGLLGTSVTFFAAFRAVNQDQSHVVFVVTEHLGSIYFLNALCIGVAILLFDKARRLARVADEVATEARRALSLLEEGAGASLKPDLVAALNESSRQLGTIYRELFDNQLREIAGLASKLQAVSDLIADLAKGVRESARNDVEAVRALEREHQAVAESLLQRLDMGFQLLAQPFLQGIPAIKSLTTSSEALSQVAGDLAGSDLVAAVQRQEAASSELQRVLAELATALNSLVLPEAQALRESLRVLPAEVEMAMVSASGQSAPQLASATKAAVAEALLPVTAEVRSQLTAATSVFSQAQSQGQQFHVDLTELLTRIDVALKVLPSELSEGVASASGRSLQAAIGDLRDTLVAHVTATLTLQRRLQDSSVASGDGRAGPGMPPVLPQG
jgi:biopolymer transport protein ExbB/TolQ